MQDFLPLERPSDAFSYTSFRGSFFKPRLHLRFETACRYPDRPGTGALRQSSQIFVEASSLRGRVLPDRSFWIVVVVGSGNNAPLKVACHRPNSIMDLRFGVLDFGRRVR